MCNYLLEFILNPLPKVLVLLPVSVVFVVRSNEDSGLSLTMLLNTGWRRDLLIKPWNILVKGKDGDRESDCYL